VNSLDQLPKEVMGKIKEETKSPILKLDNYIDNVIVFHKINPFFYDKSNMFWFWNFENYCYELTDEIDLMNLIDKKLGFSGQTVSSKIRGNYIEAFKRVGREKKPLEAPKTWIQFQDKIFDINTKEILPVNKNYFLCNPIPHVLGKNGNTPTMDKLFIDWVGEDYKQTLYEIIAYCCLADYPIHSLFCLVGSGRNGKSQFQKIVQSFLGIINVCSSELDVLIENRFESAKMYKKLICTLGETNFGIIDKTSLLKKLTGGDLIGYEFKNKMPFSAYNYSKIIINSNSLPTSLDTSDGFYRRWLILNFEREFEEGKDIVNTIPIEEYQELAFKVTQILPKILECGHFSKHGTIEERRNNYIMASNPLPFFIKKCCKRGINEYILSNDFYNSYIEFLIKNKKRKVTRKEFYDVLAEEGLNVRKTSKNHEGITENGYFIETISLNEDWKLSIFDKSDKNDKNDKILNSFFREGKLIENLRTNSTNVTEKEDMLKNFNQNLKYTHIPEKDIICHLERFGEYNMMSIIDLKDFFTELTDEQIDNMKSKGVLYEPVSGKVKKL